MNLKELSKRLNLSQTTVSRALNGYPEVNEATRKRVHEAAQKYRYSPNVRARTLATGKSMSVGHVIPLSRQSELVNMVFSDFIAGAGLVYAEHGYNMTLTIVKDADEFDAYRSFAERGAVDGVIVQAPSVKDPRIPFLTRLNIPFVVHGRASELTEPYGWLDVNNTRALRMATDKLLALGHRRIALINGLETLDFAARRRTGYEEALAAAGLTPDPDLIQSLDMSEPNGFKAATTMLKHPAPPSAFVASSTALALGIKRAVEDSGKIIGRDVSLICFDDDISYLPNAGDPPQFTAMKSSVRAAGARCATLLIKRIQNKSLALPEELWEAEYIDGASTGPAPHS